LLLFILLFLTGSTIAVLLPPTFKSESTILIENQLIPSEYVQSTITGFVEQRIQVITQQVMSSSKLQEIIDRFDLYRDLKERYTASEIIDEMRDDIGLHMISADVRDSQSGRATQATIAFRISYKGKNPAVVQKVATTLASLYLELNLENREQRATTTTTFLERELEDLRNRIDELQGRISDFKKNHLEELPEHSQVNLQAINRLTRDLDSTTMRIYQLEERLILLESEIANVDPMKPLVTRDGKLMKSPAERLKTMRLELLALQSRLSERHPDIKMLKKEIQELEKEAGPTDDSAETVRRLEDLTGQLAELKGELGPEHPDVLRLSKEVNTLADDIQKDEARQTGKRVFEDKPDNPAYINLKTQIATTNAQISALKMERTAIQEEIKHYQARIASAPLVEKEYSSMLRDLGSARQKYAELTNKLMEAQVAKGMEESQSGERFIVIDPARLPEEPFKPNRLAIALISFVLALGGGTGMAALREVMDSSVKSSEDIVSLGGGPVLSEIARMESPQERRLRWAKRGIVVLIILVAIGIGIYLFHEFVMPLEVFWAKVQRRLMKMNAF
ncbi:MAG: GNVR domain-containing protein, partial [Desulfobacteraceae bacterium]